MSVTARLALDLVGIVMCEESVSEGDCCRLRVVQVREVATSVVFAISLDLNCPLACALMPVHAEHSAGALPAWPREVLLILGIGDQAQMVGVDTSARTADVIDLHALWDSADECDVSDPVRKLHAGIDADAPVSISDRSRSPEPAGVGLVYSGPEAIPFSGCRVHDAPPPLARSRRFAAPHPGHAWRHGPRLPQSRQWPTPRCPQGLRV